MVTFFYIKAKGQGHIELMNACDVSSHGDTLMCMTISKDK